MERRSLPGRGCIPGIDAEPHAAARDLYARLIEAWNGSDADAFAELFAADGVSIGFDGSQATGDEIREHLGAVFADHQTAAYVARVREVRAVGTDPVLIRAIVGMVPPGGRPELVEEHTAEIEQVRAAGETIG